MMKRLYVHATLLFVLIAFGAHLSGVSAQPRAQEQKHAVYLPLAIGGGAAARPVDPVAVRFIDDTDRAAHAAIGPDGGTLSATAADGTRFELVVPAEALDFTETITMTPVLRAENLPLSGGLIGAVDLEPAGLGFYQPATLRIVTPAPAPGFETIGFAYNGAGEQFHLRPLALGAGNIQIQAAEVTISIEIVSIRPVGAGRGSQADIERRKAQPAPSDPLDLLEEGILLLQHYAALHEFYHRILGPDLRRAQTDASQFDQALREVDAWLYFVRAAGLTETFAFEIAEAKVLLIDTLPRAAAASADRCYTQKRPEEGFRLLRWARYARKLLPGAPLIGEIEAKLAKCLTFEITFHSVITETARGYGYYYELRTATTLRAAGSTRATGSAPLEWVDAHWTAGGPCQFSMRGDGSTFDATSGRLGFSMAPVGRTSPAVNLTLRYDPGVPAEHTTMACPGGGGFSVSTTAWSDYFTKTHDNERDDAGFRATAQVVNAGSFTGWVYHQTTTGPSGQVAVEDTQIEILHTPQR
jgi:hypothetical protein